MRAAITWWLGWTACWVAAQTAPSAEWRVPYALDSGLQHNLSRGRAVVFEEVVRVPDAAYLRLHFGASLPEAAPGAPTVVLRITSLQDGAVQHLDAADLARWEMGSAYFNGDAVRIALLADPGAPPARVRVDAVTVGPWVDARQKSLCGTTDDRVLSDDPRIARVVPVGCTAWLFDDARHCFLSAGHCVGGTFSVVEFNVPLSDAGGTPLHPPPEDQYYIDTASVQYGDDGAGHDWAYFGTHPNTETGLTAYEAQGAAFHLAAPPAVPGGQTVDITGYGTVSGAVPRTYNQAQKNHQGPFVAHADTTLTYAVDTTGGNSGSPVVHIETGNAVGIHTHPGCTETDGANRGTASDHPDLVTALSQPMGVCAPPPLLAFAFLDGLPDYLSADGCGPWVSVTPQPGVVVDALSARLYLDDGGGEQWVPMVEQTPGVFAPTYPAFACLARVRLRAYAETTLGEPVFSHTWEEAPSRPVAHQVVPVFEEAGDTHADWTVETTPGAAGGWERGLPMGDGLHGDPRRDGDGSGPCFLTGNAPGNSDVDFGTTVLTSPRMDAGETDGTAVLSYYRWYHNQGADAVDDVFRVALSNNDGLDWVVVEEVGPVGPGTAGGWIHVTVVVSDILPPTDQMRVRFEASDLGDPSRVEAGVDGVVLAGFACTPVPCAADLDGNCRVNADDLKAAGATWTQPDGVDLNGDGRADVSDLVVLLTAYGACP